MYRFKNNPTYEQVENAVNKLHALMDNPEPSLSTWHIARDEAAKNLYDLLHRIFAVRKEPLLSAKLKPCPFCGNDNILQLSIGGWLVFRCPACNFEINFLKEKDDEAIAAWNKRTKEGEAT